MPPSLLAYALEHYEFVLGAAGEDGLTFLVLDARLTRRLRQRTRENTVRKDLALLEEDGVVVHVGNRWFLAAVLKNNGVKK